ncbi:MAG: reductive dehalogenase domain-containing protein [Anaerolineae bacterium]|jgi:hypothetical protein
MILIVLGLSIFAVMVAFGLSSLGEGQTRAAWVALGLGAVAPLPLLLAALLPAPIQRGVVAAIVAVVLALVVLFLLPIGRVETGDDQPRGRYDERDIMFARMRLVPGTPEFEAYYALRPEKRAGDDKTRALPGLLSPEAREAHPPLFAATEGTFDLIEAVRDEVDGPVAPAQVEGEAGRLTAYVKGLARYWGARRVGVADLRDYHVYSYVGRGTGVYGAPIDLDHGYAVAFTVEMAWEMVASAPAAPTLLESARQYANGAKIAILLANTIRGMGYRARAHVDGNYRVIAPLVARDAGLGEFGRMGLLMTPGLGPRVRLGVVTTDLPLVVDGRRADPAVLDFCRICQKCAENCPVRAIPTGDRQQVDDALRWRIDHEVCYRYWCVTGTDCARCVAVCPYSYPDSVAHNLVRLGVAHSGFARRAVLWMDRLFYGARPQPRAAPGWVFEVDTMKDHDLG